MTRPRTVVGLDLHDYTPVQESGVEAASFEFLESPILDHGSSRRVRTAVITKETRPMTARALPIIWRLTLLHGA
jgi:hypothetical protein